MRPAHRAKQPGLHPGMQGTPRVLAGPETERLADRTHDRPGLPGPETDQERSGAHLPAGCRAVPEPGTGHAHQAGAATASPVCSHGDTHGPRVEHAAVQARH
ncbi:hypothetical protein DSECCO2_463040 [anaerobic digester metagenome]